MRRQQRSLSAYVTNPLASQDPHTGLRYATSDQDKVVVHNYMRSYWPLLILLAVCSHLAQKRWAAIFQNETLKALLQLAGSAELRQVRAAESAKPYEMLSALSRDLDQEFARRLDEGPRAAELSRNERVSRRLELVDNYVNIYDQALDYYPNQLTYLLLTRNVASYKLSCLKLRYKLLQHALLSCLLSLAQFLLPLAFLGRDYALFGWDYLSALARYMLKQLTSDSCCLDNTIDYELSSRIFPTSVQCHYRQLSYTGSVESLSIQCTIGINEISAKVFAIIWWVVAVSLAVELGSLLALLVCSLNRSTISRTFGERFWPRAVYQANLIAQFRHRRSLLMSRQQQGGPPKLASPVHLVSGGKRATGAPLAGSQDEQLRRKKALESNLSYNLDMGDGSGRSRANKWCLRGVVQALGWTGMPCDSAKRQKRLEREAERDINIYYLLYLLYLRLGSSKSKVEQVIRMTACALSNYLVELEAHCDGRKMEERSEEFDDDGDEYGSLDRAEHVIRTC